MLRVRVSQECDPLSIESKALELLSQLNSRLSASGQGLGFRVLEFRVLEFRVLEFRVLEFRVLGFRLEVLVL